MMKFSDLTFDRVTDYDPFNRRANDSGFVTSWVARNPFGNSVAFGDTKSECVKDARRYIKYINSRGGE